MSPRRHLLPVLLALALLPSLAPSRAGAQARGRAEPEPRNIILLIGDGMGPSYAALAREVGGRPLSLDSILVGSCATASTDSRVTDSAAAATALATGSRTRNAWLGLDPGGHPLTTLLEVAERRGKATGLVATSRITHATPAAFAARVPDRGMEDSIATQMMTHDVEVMLGGGARHFLPQGGGGRRRDGRDLVAEAAARGVTVVRDTRALAVVTRTPVLGLFADSHMDYELDRAGTAQPELAEMARKALELLARDPDGFFLMIEGSRIDHAGHDHDAATAAREVLEFDRAVSLALGFARRDGRTLVVATADHETGGLTLGRAVDGKAIYDWDPAVLRAVRRSVGAQFDRIRSGADPAAVLAEDAGVTDLSAGERTALALTKREWDDMHPLLVEAVSRRARIGWTTPGHTGVDVGLHAFGPGAERFRGMRRNDEVGQLLGRALGATLPEIAAGLPVPVPAHGTDDD
jgi:alkaline phosphatase